MDDMNRFPHLRMHGNRMENDPLVICRSDFWQISEHVLPQMNNHKLILMTHLGVGHAASVCQRDHDSLRMHSRIRDRPESWYVRSQPVVSRGHSCISSHQKIVAVPLIALFLMSENYRFMSTKA